MRYLSSKYFEQGQFSAVAALGLPYDPSRVFKGMKKFYSDHLAKSFLENLIKPNLNMIANDERINLKKLLATEGIFEFYRNYHCKIFGVKKVKTIMNMAKINRKMIRNIKIPLLILHSKDDPMC